MNSHDTPRQAIEDYLDALLHDDEMEQPESIMQASETQVLETQVLERQVLEEQDNYDYQPPLLTAQPEESLQARQLRESMLQQFNPVAKPAIQPVFESFERPVLLDKPLVGTQVILPNINLSSFTQPATVVETAVETELETELETPVATLADVVQKIETAQALEKQAEALDEMVLEELEEELEEQISEEDYGIQAVSEPEPSIEAIEAPIAGQPPSPPGWINGRPVWAQERFECLLFKVKGLTLAVPLVELGGIIKIEKQPTPLFGQPDWFIGMLRNNKMNVSMVDTAQWVLPAALVKKNTDPYKLVIRIHDSNWGLACNEVDRSISLKPEQVRWRTSLGKRPWLAGTVIEHMCALIDATAFDRLLKEGHGDLEPINLSALKNIDHE